MKRYILLMMFVWGAMTAAAQSNLDDVGRLTVHAVVPQYENLPVEAQKLLETKLSQIITANGIADNENSVRFVLTAKVNVIAKDIVVGPPQRISQKLDITIMLGDIQTDKVYSQMTISAMGIGQTLDKAYISAFKNIVPNNKAISEFMADGKEKLIAYYQTNGQEMLTEAKNLAAMQNYEDALIQLASIPDVCTDIFSEAARLASTIYADMIDARGREYLNAARAVWANNPTREGAQEATRLIKKINFAASAQSDVSELMEEITDKMNEIDQREWEQTVQEYKDNIEREKREWEQSVQVYQDNIQREKREWEHSQQEYRDNLEREKREWEQHVREHEDNVQTQRLRIKAYRDVAVAYAENQPKEITKVINYNKLILW